MRRSFGVSYCPVGLYYTNKCIAKDEQHAAAAAKAAKAAHGAAAVLRRHAVAAEEAGQEAVRAIQALDDARGAVEPRIQL